MRFYQLSYGNDYRLWIFAEKGSRSISFFDNKYRMTDNTDEEAWVMDIAEKVDEEIADEIVDRMMDFFKDEQ